MYKARRLVTQIYNNIHKFEELKVKARNLANVLIDFKEDAHKSKEKLVQVKRDIEKCIKDLLQDIVTLLKDNKFLGEKVFVFKKKEWVNYSQKEYEKIRNMTQKVDIRMKEIKDLQPK